MWTFLLTSLIAISIILTLCILMQEKGVGLSLTFGGQGNVYSSNRGAKKLLNYTTTAAAVLFLILSFIFVFASPRSAPVPVDADVTATGVEVDVEAEGLGDGKLDIDDFEVKQTDKGKFELTPKVEE